MEQKSIDQLTDEEILRQQLQLLAKQSKNASVEELPALTNAMIEISRLLRDKQEIEFRKIQSNKIGEFIKNMPINN